MVHFIMCVIMVAAIASFLVTLWEKWGVVEYMQVHGNDFFAKLFSCYFCLSFWASVVVSLCAFLITIDPVFIAVPFCSTTLTKKLL